MALVKTLTMPNGASCDYHRIDEPTIDVQTLCCSVEVGSYVDEEQARRSRFPAWKTRFEYVLPAPPSSDVRGWLYERLLEEAMFMGAGAA